MLLIPRRSGGAWRPGSLKASSRGVPSIDIVVDQITHSCRSVVPVSRAARVLHVWYTPSQEQRLVISPLRADRGRPGSRPARPLEAATSSPTCRARQGLLPSFRSFAGRRPSIICTPLQATIGATIGACSIHPPVGISSGRLVLDVPFTFPRGPTPSCLKRIHTRDWT